MTTSTCFAFDLDGTVTEQEILPLIADRLGLQSEMELLTRITLDGTIPFEASFRLRCAVLRTVPLSAVREVVSEVGLNREIESFIRGRPEQCFIVSGNLDVWVRPLLDRLGCASYTSEARIIGDNLLDVSSILRKGQPILDLRERFGRVVAIGESINDLPMFEAADVAIAYGGVHDPVPGVIEVADYVTYRGDSLCRLLNTLL